MIRSSESVIPKKNHCPPVDQVKKKRGDDGNHHLSIKHRTLYIMLSTSILYCNKIDEQQQPHPRHPHPLMAPHRFPHPNGFVNKGGGGGGGGGDVCESGSSAVIDADDDDDDGEVEEEEEREGNKRTKQAKNLANSRPAQLMRPNHSPCINGQYLKSPSPLLLPPLSSSSSLILNGSAISHSNHSAKSMLSTKRPPTTVVRDDGASSRFRVQYIGCNTCDYRQHKPEMGIGIYQKPMLDLYSTVLKRSVVLRSLLAVNQVADLSSHGIFIAEKDRFQQQQQPHPQHQQQRESTTGRSTSIRPSSSASSTSKQQHPQHPQHQQQQQPSPSPQSLTSDTVVTKVITPLSNILLWAAVRLQHRTQMKKLKHSAAKRRHVGVAFVPLSCSEAVLDKNAFVTLNAKQRFLLGITHPPLFVCVLQKVNSAQRLECHMFVCGNGDDAIRMCNRMDELRQQSTTIGHLQLPPPGGMGKYFYQNHHHHPPHHISPSSLLLLSTTRSSSLMSTSLLTPRSCSPSQRTFMSEQSTMIASSRPSRFSDIEEEDNIGDDHHDDQDVVDGGVETMINGGQNGHNRRTGPTVVKKLIDNYQSNQIDTNGNNIPPTTMNNLKGIKMIINNNNNHHNNHQNHLNNNHHRLHGGGGHQMMMAMMMINHNHNNNNHNKLKCDARLFDRTRRVITTKVAAGTTNTTNNNNNNHPHLMNGNGGAGGDCPSELSSIISSKISISSINNNNNNNNNNLERKNFEQLQREREQRRREPQSSSLLQQQVAAPSLMAQRDYRFESYKANNNVCNNHPVDDDDDGHDDDGGHGGGGNKSITNTPNSSIKLIKSSSSNHHHQQHHNNHHHHTTTTDMINNGPPPPSSTSQFQQQQQHRINHDRSINNNNNTNDNGNSKADNNDRNDVNDDDADDADDADADDELHKNRLFAKAAAKAVGTNLNCNANGGLVAPSGGKESNQQVQNDRIQNQNHQQNNINKKKTYLFGDSLRSRQRRKHLSTNLDLLHQSLMAKTNQDDAANNNGLKHHSIISSSIFLDNESDDRTSTSKESSVANGQHGSQKTRTKNHRNTGGPKKPQETETIRPLLPAPSTGNNRNDANSSSNTRPENRPEMDKPLKLYLPPSAVAETNLGVKGFNKSSRVEQWSTMVADNGTGTGTNGQTMNNNNNSCDLCQMELNCDECCQFCQAIEQYKQKYCQKCQPEPEYHHRRPSPVANDDFLLDESTMKHFNMNGNGSVRTRHSHSGRIPVHPDTMHYYHVPRNRSSSNTTTNGGEDPTFFNRIRRFSWQSLFGSRKKFQGSRLWNRFRSGSQRLRGSRRFFQNKSRIFLPNNSCLYAACSASPCQPGGAKGVEESTTTRNNKKKMGVVHNPYSYDEHYLKPPARQQRLLEPVFRGSRKSSLAQQNRVAPPPSLFSIDDHHDDDGKHFYGFTTANNNVQANSKTKQKKFDTRTNEKIIETNNNQDKFSASKASTTKVADLKPNHTKHGDHTRPTKPAPPRADMEDDDDVHLLEEEEEEEEEVETKIKPFFISHPGKHASNASAASAAAVERSGQPHLPPHPPQQNGISISSDSGMEEYDCHSSAEHSPSGFHNNSGGQQQQQSVHQQQQQQKQRRTMANNDNYSSNHHHRHHEHNLQQQPKLKQLELQAEQNRSKTNQNGSTTTTTTTMASKPNHHAMIPQQLSSPMKFSKDIRRQAGHWSNTNLENQLGYMP